jgi:hypothetical protein
MTTLNFPDIRRAPRIAEDFALGMRLSMSQGREIQPVELFKLLNAAKLKAVLVGGHAINARTGRPRATVDVDLVAERPTKVADAIQKAYPHLVRDEHPVVIRFKDSDHEAIDVIKPESAPLFKQILKLTEHLEIDGTILTVPDLEAMIALKFASMISPTRRVEDKYTDGRDFILMVLGGKSLDETKLTELGEFVYAGGGANVLKLVADARAGKMLDI